MSITKQESSKMIATAVDALRDELLEEWQREPKELPRCGAFFINMDGGADDQCDERAYKPRVDPRFGVPLCRECFYAAADQWRRQNQAAGLCACGMETMPGIQECRECNARRRRSNAAHANRKRRLDKALKENQAKRDRIDAAAESLTLEAVNEVVRAHQAEGRKRIAVRIIVNRLGEPWNVAVRALSRLEESTGDATPFDHRPEYGMMVMNRWLKKQGVKVSQLPIEKDDGHYPI